MDLFSLTLILFLIMDPLGNIAAYLKMVQHETPARRNRILAREMLIVLFTMILFNFIGEALFDILHFSEKTLRIASGAILFLAAIKILFPTIDSPRAQIVEEEPFVVPLAIPLLAGPALLATIMLFAHITPSISTMVLAIVLAWAFAGIILFIAPWLERVLGSNGLMAIERLLGMVLVLLAIQRFLEGVHLFVASCKL
jgi:multiple antibiotic resistance protein